MIPHLEEIVAELRQRVADPARQAVAVQLAVDVAQLSTKALAGADVENEILHCRAQAASLVATEAAAVQQVVGAWVERITGAVVKAVLVAAAG